MLLYKDEQIYFLLNIINSYDCDIKERKICIFIDEIFFKKVIVIIITDIIGSVLGNGVSNVIKKRLE